MRDRSINQCLIYYHCVEKTSEQHRVRVICREHPDIIFVVVYFKGKGNRAVIFTIIAMGHVVVGALEASE